MVAQYVSPRKGITGHEMIHASPASNKRNGLMTKITRRQAIAALVASRNAPTDLWDQAIAEMAKPAKRKRKRRTTNGSGNIDSNNDGFNNDGFNNDSFNNDSFNNDSFNYDTDSG